LVVTPVQTIIDGEGSISIICLLSVEVRNLHLVSIVGCLAGVGILDLLLGVSLRQEEFKWAFVRCSQVLCLERNVGVALELGQSEMTLLVTAI